MNKNYSVVCESINSIYEGLDKEGNETDRANRFFNRFVIGLKSDVRQLIMTLRIWLWPSYLWSHAVNICKYIFRIGTRENESYRIELLVLLRAAGDGKFKSGKEFNNAIQKVHEKYKFRKQRLLDSVDHAS